MLTKFGLRVTGAGKVLIFLSIFLLFAAQNTGNNLLYLMASSFVAGVIWSVTLCLRNIIGLKLELKVADYGVANAASSFSCVVSECAYRNHYLLGFESDFALRIHPGEKISLQGEFVPSSRGVFAMSDFCVFSFYPVDLFGAFLVAPTEKFFVAPEPLDVNLTAFSADVQRVLQQQKLGREGDYWMQLPYQDGTDASFINWAISARSLNEWVLVRNNSQGISPKLYFQLEGLEKDEFELSLRFIAGLLISLKRQSADTIVWATLESGEGVWLSLGHDFSELMRWLAIASPDNLSSPSDPDIEPVLLSKLISLRPNNEG